MTTRLNETEAAEQRRQRVTSGEIIRTLLERGQTEHSSVTITRNAKGLMQFEVVVRTGDGGAVETVQDAERVACEVTDRLSEKYPYSEQGGGGAGQP